MGVDCPISYLGLTFEIVRVEFLASVLVPKLDERRHPTGVYEEFPAPEGMYFVIVHIRFPEGTMKEDVDLMFEDGGIFVPMLADEMGTEISYETAFATNEAGVMLERIPDPPVITRIAILYLVPIDAPKPAEVMFGRGEEAIRVAIADLEVVYDIKPQADGTARPTSTPAPTATATPLFELP
jgi:hypothetical protein